MTVTATGAKRRRQYLWVILASLVFGVLFWFLDGLVEFHYFRDNLHFLIVEGPQSYWESIFSNISPHGLFVRLSFLVGAMIGGLLVLLILIRRNQAEAALRESEDKYRTILENIYDVYYRVDLRGRLLMISPSGVRLLEYAGPEEMIGRDIAQTFCYAPEALGRLLREVIKQGHVRFQVNLITKGGRPLIAEANSRLIHDKTGRPVAVEGIFRDITEQKKIEEELVSKSERLLALDSELLLAEERERRRIAVSLHDNIGQSLALSKIMLKKLQSRCVSDDEREMIDEVCHLVEIMIRDTRSLTLELSPPVLYELGLESALDWLAEEIGRKHDLQICFNANGSSPDLDDNLKVLLYRAVRELLLNIVKHAEATTASVSLRSNAKELSVEVKDNGIGFEAASLMENSKGSATFGHFSIRERLGNLGGRIEIFSEKGQGTRVALTVPLKE